MDINAERIATLRHDLNTPVNQILGYAEMVGEDLGEENGQMREDVAKIVSAAKRLTEMISREIRSERMTFVEVENGEDRGAKAEDVPEVLVVESEEARVNEVGGEETATVPAKILIVDDNAGNCAVLKQRLEREGHQCAVSLSGAEALELLACEDFDLVLLDVMMPDMDGFAVLRRIKSDELLRYIPVIMISALDEIGSVVACIEGGAEDYLTKPFNPVLLRARIGASIDRKRLQDAEQAAFDALHESQKKLSDELAEAAAYVHGVLPLPLEEGGVRASWKFLPSSSLGGDAFSYGFFEDGKFRVCLLDVCGHGVGAALLSISVLNVIRSESLPDVDFSDPGKILDGLNTAFPMEKHGEMFFTAWCGVYDPRTRKMQFAAGGHPPAILKERGGATCLLAAKGPVIGACDGMEFATSEAVISEGARVYVFSDGAYEIRTSEETMMGFEDFQKIVEEAPEDGTLDWIMERLRELNAGEVFDDDVSVVVLFFF